MTDKTESTKSELPLMFVRLRNINEDLIGYVKEDDQTGYLLIQKPLVLDVHTIYEERRQIVLMHEYMPQAVIEETEIMFPMEDVLFVSPIREVFREHYEYVSNFYYNPESRNSDTMKRTNLTSTPQSMEPEEEPEPLDMEYFDEVINKGKKKDQPIH